MKIICCAVLVAATACGQVTLTLDQPQGPGSLRILNQGGVPGDLAFTALSFDPANAGSALGSGPLYGLYLDVETFLLQADLGFPFVQTVDAVGETLYELPGSYFGVPLPPLYGVTTSWSQMPLTFVGASNVAALTVQAGPPAWLNYQLRTLPFSAGNRHSVVADLNLDGIPDLANSAAIWLGDGAFGFTAIDIDPGGVEAEVADVDLDGFVDLIVLDEVFNGLKIYPGDGTGRFDLPPQQLPFFTGDIGDVRVTDLDLDGWPDLVCSAGTTTAPGVIRFLNDGTGTFYLFSATIGSGSTACEAADLTGDGKPELILDIIPFAGGLNAEETRILWGQFSPVHGLSNSILLDDLPEAATRWVRAKDMDGDGLNDLLWAGTQNAGVLFNEGGLFPTFHYAPFAIGPTETCCPLPRLEAIDLDGDGDLDGVGLATVEGVRYLVFSIQGPNRTFVETFYLPGPAADAGFVIASDIDGDGDEDLVVGGSPALIFEKL